MHATGGPNYETVLRESCETDIHMGPHSENIPFEQRGGNSCFFYTHIWIRNEQEAHSGLWVRLCKGNEIIPRLMEAYTETVGGQDSER